MRHAHSGGRLCCELFALSEEPLPSLIRTSAIMAAAPTYCLSSTLCAKACCIPPSPLSLSTAAIASPLLAHPHGKPSFSLNLALNGTLRVRVQEQQAAANIAMARTIALRGHVGNSKGNSGELIHSSLKLPTLATIPDEPGLKLPAKHANKVAGL